MYHYVPRIAGIGAPVIRPHPRLGGRAKNLPNGPDRATYGPMSEVNDIYQNWKKSLKEKNQSELLREIALEINRIGWGSAYDPLQRGAIEAAVMEIKPILSDISESLRQIAEKLD